MKSALFVDFDNVYSGLRRMDPAIADRFARQPLEWVNWLTDSHGLPDHAPKGAKRRLLVRRCYLNPAAYQRFRPSFNRAGFEIVDCPAMTSEGKTSTDIHMVLDIVDLLQHEAHYDEFIVFSADADFTPVLRRLRRWDRRTTVLAIGFPSAAYQASADLLIDQDFFVRDALGFEDDEEPEAGAPPAPSSMPARAAGATTEPNHLAAHVTQVIRQMVAESPRAIALAHVAQLLPSRVKGLEAGKWGTGGFRGMIDKLDLAPLVITWEGGGHIRDPRRHTGPNAGNGAVAGDEWGGDREMLAVARQVHDATGVPLLTPREYGALFQILAANLRAHPYQINETGKRVRDQCRTAGHGISRADVSFVLMGLTFVGHVFGSGNDGADVLAERFADNAIALCRREQMVDDESTTTAIRKWIQGHAGAAPDDEAKARETPYAK
jgi:hypothetical protein